VFESGLRLPAAAASGLAYLDGYKYRWLYIINLSHRNNINFDLSM
jgi:hypothetical protein